MDSVYNLQDNYIDMSQIKTFRLTTILPIDKEKKRVEITLKDKRVKIEGGEYEYHSETVDVIFKDQVTASRECEALREAWGGGH